MTRHDQHNPHDEHDDDADQPLEIALTGELGGDEQGELHEKLLGVPHEGECTIFINSPGGDPYCALSLMTLIQYRRLNCTAIVTGECSSAALWPFAACRRRLVTKYSVFLFHMARWESAENINHQEAQQWAQHFVELASDTEALLARMLKLPEDLMQQWTREGRYVSGPELAGHGCAEMLDLENP